LSLLDLDNTVLVLPSSSPLKLPSASINPLNKASRGIEESQDKKSKKDYTIFYYFKNKDYYKK
jgi:hypothetical protein